MRLLYLEGDRCSPKYVRGGLTTLGFEVETVVGEAWRGDSSAFDACILSDYRASLLDEPTMRDLADAVEAGLGLAMVGGWFSFGRGGWAGTRLAAILPVHVEAGDDRVARPAGSVLEPDEPHPVTDGLPWTSPPAVAGHNRVRPRPEAVVALRARPVQARGGGIFGPAPQADPILVLGEHGRGRVAALAADLAPHWSGGWTDWGDRLVDVGEEEEELGTAYLRFLAQLVAWLGNAPVPEEARRVVATA